MHPTRFILGSVVAIALTGLPAVSAHADQPTPSAGRSSTPSASAKRIKKDADVLPAPRHGRTAIRALGSNFRSVARSNHLSAARLTHILTTDPTAWISAGGHLFYADTASPNNHEVAASIPPPSQPLGSTFSLHSDLNSPYKIYLDFNGTSIASGGEGDAWINPDPGQPSNGFNPGTYKGFSIDSDYTTFSDTEKAYIQHVWEMVSEKYSAWDVDVTTDTSTTPAAYDRSDSGDTHYGDHVVFTNDAAAKPALACPDGCVGIAFVGGFSALDTKGELEPAWVYTSSMLDYPGEAANTAAHEIGHTLGLHHDGLGAGDDSSPANASYYSGHGSWFPIMGAGANAVAQFSKGEYATADNTEDDLAIIGSELPLQPDNEGSVASPISLGTPATYATDGTITSANDVDVFTLTTACVTDLTAAASGTGEGQMLDLKVSILNQTGSSVLKSSDPASGQDTSTFPYLPTGLDADDTDAAVVTTAPAGTYRVQVQGVGSGDPATDGYSSYSSIGRYHLAINGCADASGTVPSMPQTISSSSTAGTTSANISWTAPSNPGTSGGNPTTVTGYRISGLPGGTKDVLASNTQYTATALTPGTSYTFHVAAINATGVGPAAATGVYVRTFMPTTAATMKVTVSKNMATFDFTDPPNPGHATFTNWKLTIGSQVFNTDYNQYTGIILGPFVSNGTYKAQLTLQGTADYGSQTPTYTKYLVVGATAPRIGLPISGKKGKPVTVGIRWALPSSLGGYPITGWKAIAYKLTKSGALGRGYITGMLSPRARSFNGRLPAGKYKFRVVAYNALGQSPPSAYSRVGVAR